ncbi:M23 family metallopeptidase [Kordiimonas marina]|uniref:M23 family metallopeptidase n=1 Tax=Kordiimonas marina TaxID=2872312 RepID=UPI001FF6C5E1|nr:M23 family metallopeptidase [Kordiimonas marina]MCJ9428719.1 M23 family metallopeptidase [Kordiimonas marina]
MTKTRLTLSLSRALIPFLSALAFSGPVAPAHAAAPADAPPVAPKLGFPVACTLGKDCWIARYVDRTKGPEISDYTCGKRTQDGHAGTDIAVADMGRMRKGVAVLATAPGTVLRLRDGVKDESVKERGQAAIKGRECGNGLVISHGDGYVSQYCHLKAGSIKVKVGDKVTKGEPVAEIGLSGETEYPHVHYMVRLNGQVIDPFDGGLYNGGCKSGHGALWAKPITYEPGVLLPLQFSTKVRPRDSVWDAPVKEISANSPALVLMARGFHVRKGDRWHLAIFDPLGHLYTERELVMRADKQFYYQYIGRKVRGGGLIPGLWTGVLMLTGPSARAGLAPTKIKTHILVRKR